MCLITNEMGKIIKLGHMYLTRIGQKVRIYAVDGGKNSQYVHGAILTKNDGWQQRKWLKSGFVDNGIFENDLDIASDYIDFDWDCLPKWCNKYIIKDSENKHWYALANEPNITSTSNLIITGDYLIINQDYCPQYFFGDWYNSLFKNPNI